MVGCLDSAVTKSDVMMMGNDTFRILGIPGSLRRDSFNRWLVEAAVAAAPGRDDSGDRGPETDSVLRW